MREEIVMKTKNENSQCGSHSRQVAPADLLALDNGSAQVALDR